MPKLHELLAAEKTPTGAWNALLEETKKKFGNPHFFEGHSKSLKMIEDSPQNAATEAQAREEKPVTTNVFDTLDYALGIFANSENLQASKNITNTRALADVRFRGETILTELPVDELLGLEARLARIKDLYLAIPTLDASKHWEVDTEAGTHQWRAKFAEDTTKTEKTIVPVTLKEATKEHPAQVQVVSKDQVVGMFTTQRRSGAATAIEKSEAIKLVDELLIEIKQARMRANQTEVAPTVSVGEVLKKILLSPFAG